MNSIKYQQAVQFKKKKKDQVASFRSSSDWMVRRETGVYEQTVSQFDLQV
jgi:hypothetical protein